MAQLRDHTVVASSEFFSFFQPGDSWLLSVPITNDFSSCYFHTQNENAVKMFEQSFESRMKYCSARPIKRKREFNFRDPNGLRFKKAKRKICNKF